MKKLWPFLRLIGPKVFSNFLRKFLGPITEKSTVSKEKKRSWVARELSNPKYKPKVQRVKTEYQRKNKKNKGYEDEL